MGPEMRTTAARSVANQLRQALKICERIIDGDTTADSARDLRGHLCLGADYAAILLPQWDRRVHFAVLPKLSQVALGPAGRTAPAPAKAGPGQHAEGITDGL